MHSHCVQRKKESELILLQSSLLLRITRNELVADAGFRTGKILVHSLFTSTFKMSHKRCLSRLDKQCPSRLGVTFCGKGKISKNRILLMGGWHFAGKEKFLKLGSYCWKSNWYEVRYILLTSLVRSSSVWSQSDILTGNGFHMVIICKTISKLSCRTKPKGFSMKMDLFRYNWVQYE